MISLNDEHALLADAIDQLVSARLEPLAAEIDASDEADQDLIAELHSHGFLAIDIPPDFGGAGADLRAVLLVLSRISRESAAMAALPASCHAVAAAFVAGNGPAADGFDVEILSQCALVDGLGSVRAEAASDGWALSGQVGRVDTPAQPEQIVALIRTEDSLNTNGSVSAILLPVERAGITLGSADRRTGLRGAVTRTLTFDSVLVGARDVIGDADAVAAAIQHRLLTTSARANGVARAALTAGIKYLAERRQFGVRLQEMTGLRALVGTAAARVSAAEALTWEVAGRHDALAPNSHGACAEVALISTECAVSVATDALQLHGGYGYVHDYPIERLLRDALSLRAALGGTRPLRAAAANGLLGAPNE
jgi:alkylation response protein AidB-like acyl-CoA dehydrogenase